MATAPSQHRDRDKRAPIGARNSARAWSQPTKQSAHIKSGDRVVISIAQPTPLTLCTALSGRLMELENVVVNHGAAAFNWDLPGLGRTLSPRVDVLLAVRSLGVSSRRGGVHPDFLLSRRPSAAGAREFQRLPDERVAAR